MTYDLTSSFGILSCPIVGMCYHKSARSDQDEFPSSVNNPLNDVRPTNLPSGRGDH